MLLRFNVLPSVLSVSAIIGDRRVDSFFYSYLVTTVGVYKIQICPFSCGGHSATNLHLVGVGNSKIICSGLVYSHISLNIDYYTAGVASQTES